MAQSESHTRDEMPAGSDAVISDAPIALPVQSPAKESHSSPRMKPMAVQQPKPATPSNSPFAKCGGCIWSWLNTHDLLTVPAARFTCHSRVLPLPHSQLPAQRKPLVMLCRRPSAAIRTCWPRAKRPCLTPISADQSKSSSAAKRSTAFVCKTKAMCPPKESWPRFEFQVGQKS